MKIVVSAMLLISLLDFSLVPAEAHTQSYGFLRAAINSNQISGQLELAVRDLDLAYDLDADGDGKVTWGELRQRETGLIPMVFRQISIGPAGKPCTLVPQPISIDTKGGENYAIFPFSGHCESASGPIHVGYNLMFGRDAQHRGLIDLTLDSSSRSTVMTPENRLKEIDFQSGSMFDVIQAFIAHGANHIWTGYDHMLFLCTLLLSSVLIRNEAKWRPVPTLRSALWATARVVTAFTIAHSITLSAAAFNIVNLPSRIVECVIAASVAVAAINNLWPLVSRRIWIAAFVFGLMHGFGFASALTDLGLPPARKLAALLSFNMGVELGQLVIVALTLPVLFCMRQTNVYSRWAMPAASLAISIIGFLWLFQRATGMSIISG